MLTLLEAPSDRLSDTRASAAALVPEWPGEFPERLRVARYRDLPPDEREAISSNFLVNGDDTRFVSVSCQHCGAQSGWWSLEGEFYQQGCVRRLSKRSPAAMVMIANSVNLSFSESCAASHYRQMAYACRKQLRAKRRAERARVRMTVR